MYSYSREDVGLKKQWRAERIVILFNALRIDKLWRSESSATKIAIILKSANFSFT